MSTTTVQTQLRNAELTDLVGLLRQQQDVRYDVVASSDRISYVGGNLVVKDGATEVLGVNPDGSLAESVTNSILRPTDVFESGLSERLGIPRQYVRKLRENAISEAGVNELIDVPDEIVANVYADLLDHNVNVWLAADPSRKFLIRGFLASGDTEGIARAFLSDRHAQYDNLDMLLAALDGAKRTGVHLDVISADLSERRMRVRVACPEIAALAPTLLANYRSPFDDTDPRRAAALAAHGWLRPDERPVVFAGFDIGNSETGNGSLSVKPVITVQACKNGLVINVDAFSRVHLGGRLTEGIVDWSSDTRKKNIELVAAQTADAVSQFVSQDFLQAKVDEIEAKAGARIDRPTETLERVTKQFGFSETEADLILADFISGGQNTAGGVLNAVTSAAQRIEDPDRANEIELVALDVFASVAAAN